jgi:regulator of replication initiation timing
MSKVPLEQVIEEAKSLTLEEQRQLREALEDEAHSAEQAERDQLASSIRGKYADVLSSSEEFAARKAEEIALEDRH